MKKYILLLFCLLSVVSTTHVLAQGVTSTTGVFNNTHATNSSLFQTNGTTRMTIVNSGGTAGNVGIGTTTPSEKLNVSGNILSSGNVTATGNLLSTAGIFNVNHASNPFAFQTNGTTRLTLTSSGNLGIGTTSPSQKLEVNGHMAFTPGYSNYFYMNANDDGFFGLALSPTYSAHGIFYVRSISPGNPSYPDIISLSPNGGNADGGVVNVYSTGKVGIAKNNPGYTLDVNGIVNATGVYINGAPFAGGGSQWTTTGSDIYFPTGNVGVGTTTPSSKLHVVGNITSSATISGGSLSTTGNAYVGGAINLGGSLGIINNSGMGDIAIQSDGDNKIFISSYGHYTEFLEGMSGSLENGKRIRINGETCTISSTFQGSSSFAPLNFETSNLNRMTILADGKVGIGKTNPSYLVDVNGTVNATSLLVNGVAVGDLSVWSMSGSHINYATGTVGIGVTNTGSFKLAVDGKIGAREVTVTTATPWPDYVFGSDYKLPSLEEVEAFIKEHKHLSEVPTAKEVEANGIELGNTNAILLKKIEELTLYVIELKKEMDELKKNQSTK